MDRKEHLERLVEVLLNKSEEIGDRDDVAMDLSKYDDDVAEQALITITCDHTDEEIVIDSAGESLSQIWKRKNKFDQSIVDKMHRDAKRYFTVNKSDEHH